MGAVELIGCDDHLAVLKLEVDGMFCQGVHIPSKRLPEHLLARPVVVGLPSGAVERAVAVLRHLQFTDKAVGVLALLLVEIFHIKLSAP